MDFMRLKRQFRKILLRLRFKVVQYLYSIIFSLNFKSSIDQRDLSHQRISKVKHTETGLDFVEKYAKLYHLNCEDFVTYLTSTPRYTTVRVNVKNYKPEDLVDLFKKQLSERYGETPEIYIHPWLDDCVVIGPLQSLSQSVVDHPIQIIVDQACALAVLRGAHIFAPGVLAMPLGVQVGAQVSVYVDISRKCLRGQTAPYSQEKLLIASGVMKMNRFQLFVNNETPPRGIAVEITHVLSQIPHVHLTPRLGLLQYLPSTLAAHTLEVQPGHKVLDMCAAPGNKLTHLAQLMNDTGTLIALDKSRSRLAKLQDAVKELNFSCIQAHVFDSTLIVSTSTEDVDRMGLHKESFDRILLDAPCSGFGQRPMFHSGLSALNLSRHIRSYTHIQRKLLEAAILLLKTGGLLVYCTCSLSVDENEEMIAWLLARHRELELVSAQPQLGSMGLTHEGLSEADRACMQRFGPRPSAVGPDKDTIGFFLCKMRKK